ncbi:MAG: hypothetical protein GXP63_03835 [DPANN group archaeon]|nr:hypothetical protein [DPANN group archaeon]
MKGSYDLWGQSLEHLKNLEQGINIKKSEITESHEIASKLLGWEHIYLHLSEKCGGDKALHAANEDLFDKIQEILFILQENDLQELAIEKEEEHIKNSLRDGIQHKDWRATKKVLIKQSKAQKRSVRLDKGTLAMLMKRFTDLHKIINNVEGPSSKKGVAHVYLLRIDMVFRTYVKVFRDLFQKEKLLIKR